MAKSRPEMESPTDDALCASHGILYGDSNAGKEALDAFKRSSKPKRTGKPDAVEDVTEMPETIDMAEDEKQADW